MTSNLLSWRFKIFIKIIFSRIPVAYSIWRKIGLFRHGAMDDFTYPLNVFNSHLEKTGLVGNLNGKTILEIGPGDSISTAILASSFGAQTIMVDAGSYATRDIESYRDMVNDFQNKGLIFPFDINNIHTIDELLLNCNAKYLTNGLNSLLKIESNSVDLIFSQAVLEHIRKNEFLDTMNHYYRILKKNGICSHQIDLKDHLGGSLNNLRFSEKIWESKFFSGSGFYTNRIRFSQMIKVFEKIGYKTLVTKKYSWSKLPISRNKLNTNFANLNEEDLLINLFDVILKKSS